MFKFTEEKTNVSDATLDKLVRELPVGGIACQYKIHSETDLDAYDFADKKKYESFFRQFADYANPLWKEKTTVEWNFNAFPFREPSDTIQGLYRIWKTGGVHGKGLDDGLASQLEEKYRMFFQKDSKRLIIFCTIQEDYRNQDISGGYGMSDQFLDLKKISTWFEIVAWDGLMFIINPEDSRLYVIAYTDTD